MWTRFVLKNFKSIGEAGVDLELKPLTLLVGPNGSGKSSILEAFCLLSQQQNMSDFQLGGQLVQFPGLEDVAHKHELQRWITWELHGGSWGLRYQFRPDTAEEAETVLNNGADYLTVKMEGDRRVGRKLKVQLPGQPPSKAVGNVLGKLAGNVFEEVARTLYETRTDLETEEARLRERYPTMYPVETRTDFKTAAAAVDEIAGMLQDRGIRKVFLLGPHRGRTPIKAEPSEAVDWVGVGGEKIVTILSVLGSPTYEPQWEKIVSWAEKFGLLKLRAGLRGSGILAADYYDPGLKTTVNLAFAGHGSRQVAAIVTQLFWAPPGSLIMIEEPEISLHPEAQVKLGELFAEAIQEDKQVIATTHSHFLLLALGRVVQKGLLKRDDIAVYHVTKDEGGTKATKVKLSKRGYPLGWPPSFAKVEKELALEWAKGLSETAS